MKKLLLGIVLIVALAIVTQHKSEQLLQRPTVLKLGPVPHAGLLKALAGEHRSYLSFRTVTRVMFYFGSFFEEYFNRVQKVPDYFSMYKHLENAVRLDPYNLDAYYFAQAAFTWEIGHAKDVNKMLEYGIRHRTWDYWLPFYAGFNAAYFLQDYDAAARYMKKAAELSGNSLFTRLASRYFHEAGQTELGLAFLNTMAENAKNNNMQNVYQQRINALQAVVEIEEALQSYQENFNQTPENLEDLVGQGILDSLPEDPYGGDFYLDENGKVQSSSKFAMRKEKPQQQDGLNDMEESDGGSEHPIQVENLSKNFRDKRLRRVQALEDVTFKVEPGEILGFLGPNGAGKSTTIKVLMGLIRPTAGKALLCGGSSSDPATRRHVGYLPEHPAFYDFLTAWEYLGFVGASFQMSRQEIDRARQKVLEKLDLTGAAKRPIRGYSKGMVQRLGLAQALLHDPDVYILDEPMSGLDPQGRALVKDIILDLGEKGKTVFFSTHITADVESVCDRLGIVVDGRLQVVTSVDDILRSGVQGYRVLLKGEVGSFTVGTRIESGSQNRNALQVEADQLPELMQQISQSDASVEYVEPLRRNLEDYFLETVKQARS